MSKIFSVIPVMKKMAPVLLVSAFLLPSPVRAEIKAGSVELSPFLGYSFFENRQNLKHSPIIGGRVGYNFTEHFGAEFTGQYTGSSVDDRSQAFTRQGQFTSPIDDVNIGMYHLDLMYHFMPEEKLNPFVTAGYGVVHYSPDINTKRNMSVVNVGVGAKYWVAENIALRVDLRDNMIFDEHIHNVEATTGVVFRFGGKSNTAVAQAPAQAQAPAPAPAPAPTPTPTPADGDGDGVYDAQDRCPGTPKGVVVDSNGCPLESGAAVVEQEVVVLSFEDVHFDFDQSHLKPEAKIILKRNIDLLKENPRTRIRISGHTSAAGTEEYNQKLSERRADAVRAYLVEEGVIGPDRLTVVGYGQTRPAVYEPRPDELRSDAAKANIRVLFEITVK